MRTARGAGRVDFDFALLAEVLPDDRDRELPEPLLRDDPEVRDAGGEDVRVAMVMTLGPSHTSHRDHTERVAAMRARPGGEPPADIQAPAQTSQDVFRSVLDLTASRP